MEVFVVTMIWTASLALTAFVLALGGRVALWLAASIDRARRS